jgi:hypothetical protein
MKVRTQIKSGKLVSNHNQSAIKRAKVRAKR